VKIRFIVQSRTEEDCPDRSGPGAHKRLRIAYSLPGGEFAEPMAGDAYWEPCSGSPTCLHGWSNCAGGPHLVVLCPSPGSGGYHPWYVDSRAGNCTLKSDTEHRCWVRHGSPEDGTIHVDKKGRTCAAGAGSIQTGKWHGFLHHGELRP